MFRTSRIIAVIVAALGALLVLGACAGTGESWAEKYGSPPSRPTPTVSPSAVPSPSRTLLTPEAVQQKRNATEADYKAALATTTASFERWLVKQQLDLARLTVAERRGKAAAFFCQSDRGDQAFEFLLVELGATRQFGISADGQQVETWLEGMDTVAGPLTAALNACVEPTTR